MIRGSIVASDKELVTNQGFQLLSWASSDIAIEYVSGCNDAEKGMYVALAIKLYNKSRNLISDAHKEIRVVLKASAAWLLQTFSQLTPSATITVVKLLARASQDLQEFHRMKGYALNCSIKATKLWSHLNMEKLTETLPPIEYQDFKVSVFQSFLDIAILSADNEVSRKAIFGALEIVQHLSMGLKKVYVSTVISLASQHLKAERYIEAINDYRLAMQIVDEVIAKHKQPMTHLERAVAVANSNSTDSIVNDYNLFIRHKVRVQLCISHAFISTR